MNKIKIMDTNLSNKIAAGEVVESIYSVVKELVENSIDADSTNIKINLIDYGLQTIKVVDNGNGMNKQDAEISVLRHATSKLLNEEDLWSINTLGFRGEALPSIASVSKMEILTSDGKDSTKLLVEESEIKKSTKGEKRKGTIVTINSLFYNTPARLKHLKTMHRELADVSNYVQKIALAYPNISFELTNDNKVLLKTDGSGSILKVINDIYGVNVTKKMLEINGENEDYKVTGFVSTPDVYKSTRNNITVLVNGRNVKNNDVIKSVLDAYHTYLPDSKIPIVILNIVVDPTIIDVNIHPAKLTVKFSKLDQLKDLIFNVIRARLNKELLIPSSTNEKIETAVIEENKAVVYEQQAIDFNEIKPPLKLEPNQEVQKMPYMEAKGFVKGTYIIAEDEKCMYLIDQHAAEERINYEYYLNKLNNDKDDVVQVLIPFVVELTKNEYIILEQNFNLLDDLKIGYQELGDNTIAINSHPAWLPKATSEEAVKLIIEVIINVEGKFDLAKFNDNIAKMVSCRASVKAGDKVDLKEAQELINNLRTISNPYTCPHGRPTIVSFTNYELEKLFKRASV